MRPSPLFVSASQYVQHGAVGKLFVTSSHKLIKNSITICKVGIFREEKNVNVYHDRMTLQEQKFHIWQKKQSSTNKKVR